VPCGGSRNLHDYFVEVGLLKFQKSGQFPYELVRIEKARGKDKTYE
jgi:hypothetical protein